MCLTDRKRQGFSLWEVIIVLTIGSIVMGGIGIFFGAYSEKMKVESAVYNGTTYHRAPSDAAFTDALALHAEFLRLIEGAYAVYLIGGERSNPVYPSRRVPPLSLGTVPASVTVRGNAYEVARDLLGASANTNYTGTGFSIVIVSSRSGTVSGVAQVRRQDVSGRRYYACTLENPSGGSWGYYFYTESGEHHGEDILAEARAYWYRWDAWLRRYEQGPSRVVFPDPLIPTSNNTSYALVGSNTTSAFSRFAYFLDEY